MSASLSAEQKEAFAAFYSETKDLLRWKLDGRFGAYSASFEVGDADQLSGLLDRLMPTIYDVTNLSEAGDAVKAVLNNMGGLCSGQKFFCTDPADESFLYGAWWPWGNGTTISIRIGSRSGDLDTLQEIFDQK